MWVLALLINWVLGNFLIIKCIRFFFFLQIRQNHNPALKLHIHTLGISEIYFKSCENGIIPPVWYIFAFFCGMLHIMQFINSYKIHTKSKSSTQLWQMSSCLNCKNCKDSEQTSQCQKSDTSHVHFYRWKWSRSKNTITILLFTLSLKTQMCHMHGYYR